MNAAVTEGVISRSSVAALIPAYREAGHIAEVVERTIKQLPQVCVVDDGSDDTTAELARKAGAEVIIHEVNQGKGAAIKTGFRHLLKTGCSYILVLDGDGQHLPEEIPRFLAAAASGDLAFVVGTRMNDKAAMPFVRRMTNLYMSWQISRVCGQRIPDSQCGFRMIRLDVIPHLFCESNNYDYETEMLIIAARKGFQIGAAEVSTVYGTEKSKIHPVRDTIRFFKLLSRYR
jgi:glycosyltransferase involved in cell wall biosynthesis